MDGMHGMDVERMMDLAATRVAGERVVVWAKENMPALVAGFREQARKEMDEPLILGADVSRRLHVLEAVTGMDIDEFISDTLRKSNW